MTSYQGTDGRRGGIDVTVTGLDVLVRAAEAEALEAGGEAYPAPGGRGGTKGMFRDGDFTAVSVRVDQLRDSVESTVTALREVFGRVAEAGGRFPLKEVQVSFEVSAKGGIRLVGTSEVEGRGGITLVFGVRDPSA